MQRLVEGLLPVKVSGEVALKREKAQVKNVIGLLPVGVDQECRDP